MHTNFNIYNFSGVWALCPPAGLRLVRGVMCELISCIVGCVVVIFLLYVFFGICIFVLRTVQASHTFFRLAEEILTTRLSA